MKTKIIKDRSTGEYVIKVYDASGRRQPASDYYTDDLEDAKLTLAAMVKADHCS